MCLLSTWVSTGVATGEKQATWVLSGDTWFFSSERLSFSAMITSSHGRVLLLALAELYAWPRLPTQL